MLDAYIIDAIRREEETRSDRARARLELPLEGPTRPEMGHPARPTDGPAREPHIIIIPLNDVGDEEDEEEAA